MFGLETGTDEKGNGNAVREIRRHEKIPHTLLIFCTVGRIMRIIQSGL